MVNMNYAAIIPYYTLTGANETYCFLEDGTRVSYPYSSKRFISRLFYSYHIDPVLRKHWAIQVLYMKHYLPLVLKSDMIFIPIKIRTHVPMHDGVLGYILVSSIKSYEDFKVTLTNNVIIETLSSAAYISKKLREAHLLRHSYKELMQSYPYMKE